MPRTTLRSAIGILAPVLLCTPCLADHHLMQIERIVPSVNGDTSAQAIQLRMRADGQNVMAGSRIVAYDAAGANPVILFAFTANVPNGGSGDRILLTTAAFDSLTTPNAVADLALTDRIPDSYFAAGRLTFEQNDGTIFWSLAWGGNGYTGSTTGGVINDSDAQFGPPFASALASSAVYPNAATAVQTLLAATALSTANNVDYETAATGGTVTNNNGDSFVVDGGPKSIVVTRPVRSSNVHPGDSFDIKWDFTGNIGPKVRIELFDGANKIDTIVQQTKYNKKFTWAVPGNLPAGNAYRIRVLDKPNGVSDKSKAFLVTPHK